jgi:hypothetical protein
LSFPVDYDANNPDGLTITPSEVSRVLLQQRVDTLFNLGCSRNCAIKIGDMVPTMTPNFALVFDDIATHSVLLADVCADCHWCPKIRFGDWPVIISELREYVKNKQIARDVVDIERRLNFWSRPMKLAFYKNRRR